MNKNILLGLVASFAMLATFTGCNEEYTLYQGEE